MRLLAPGTVFTARVYQSYIARRQAVDIERWFLNHWYSISLERRQEGILPEELIYKPVTQLHNGQWLARGVLDAGEKSCTMFFDEMINHG